MTQVVDASVVVKWLIPEEGSAAAGEVLRAPCAAPDLLIPECLNALWRVVGRGALEPGEAMHAARLLAASGITLEPTQPLAPAILSLSLRLDHPAYDCAYLALARELDGVLVTADRRLLARCRQPDSADLAPHVRSLFEPANEVRETAARPYRPRRRAGVRS